MHARVTLTLLLAVITVNNSENKFGGFKNASRGSQNQGNNDQTDLIKMEIKKYMSECGADVSEEDGSESQNNNHNFSSNNNNNNNNGGNNYNSGRYGNNRGQNGQQNYGTDGYGNQNSNNQRSSSGYGQNYGTSYPSHDYSRDQNRNYPQTSYGSWGSSDSGSYSNIHGHMDNNRSDFRSHKGNYGYGHDASGYGARNADTMSRKTGNYGSGSYGSRRDSFSYDDGYIRSKRSEDDVECISQCVFGYLEVLDDNRSPSESAMLKWLQDHLPNDAKRIKAMRDARRCFARLAASDNDDGCAFSKSLSNCLNLEIEQ